jgi:hypothetical protein
MKEIISDSGQRIAIYDNLFDFHYTNDIYDFATKSYFQIGWEDTHILENSKHRYLHSVYSQEDLDNLGIVEKIKATKAGEELIGYTIEKTILNLSTPADTHFIHTHSNHKVLLYYVNLNWNDGWHGETLFYKNNTKEIFFATPYVPGRLLFFDAAIPHTIRPQSHTASHYRFTLSIFLNKC